MAEFPVLPPSITELRELSDFEDLQCTEEELKTVQECFNYTINAYREIDRLSEASTQEKSTRTSTGLLSPDVATFNAWSVQCDVQESQTGLLQGKTFAVSDNVAVADVETMTSRSVSQEGCVPKYDATVVKRILDAGAIVKGKAVCESLIFSANSENFVQNPVDRSRIAGWASAGVAALVSGNVVDMGLGVDTGGSLRISASWTGTMGLKPTSSLVSLNGVISAERTLDAVGTVTQSANDCAQLLQVISGKDAGYDPLQTPAEGKPYVEEIKSPLGTMNIGLVEEGFGVADNDVAELVRQAAVQLQSDNIQIKPVSVPEHLDGQAIWGSMFLQGSTQILKNSSDTYSNDVADNGLCQLPRGTKAMYLMAKYVEHQRSNQYYMKAQNATEKLRAAYDNALQTFDILIMPTVPFTAPTHVPQGDLTAESYMTGMKSVSNTAPFNCTGHPALTINVGSVNGLPVGMMLVSKKYHDLTVLRVASAYEKLFEDTSMDTRQNEA